MPYSNIVFASRENSSPFSFTLFGILCKENIRLFRSSVQEQVMISKGPDAMHPYGKL